MPELTVTVYTAGPSCQPCKATLRHLDRLGIAYTTVSIDSDDAIREAAIELGMKTAPIVCVATAAGEDHSDGYRPDRIDALVTEAA
ncbi:glutaredoxin family protein [Mycobacteroides abscessus]|uniref:glutaredoxin family protein n=1 Tax=Mycobacteroides TaxID=670516 RepID=UPI000E68F1B5|nr:MULTISPECIES: glutaredoxin family protein [Mycobacteroides]RIT33772.1 glutaredoxin family protein [Mycobacteroides abscessus]WJR32450.1 glutaredoxin family protein [Mycobacteroides immunogenum]